MDHLPGKRLIKRLFESLVRVDLPLDLVIFPWQSAVRCGR